MLYTSDNTNEIENYCFNLENRQIIKKFEDISFINFIGNTKYKAFHLKTGGIAIYNLANNRKISHIDGRFSLINYIDEFNIILNARATNILSFYDSEHGKFTWNSDLTTYGTIRKILGVSGERFWVSCMRVDENRNTKAHLVALNVNTGEILHHLSDGLPLHEIHIELLEEKQTIVSCWGKMSSHSKAESPFVEIDALTGEVIRNTFSQSMYDANLKLGQWKYLDNKIYFDAAFDTINSTHIGVMDYDALELQWSTEVKDRKAGLRNLQVTEDKIYIMDSGSQLFIYEKEVTKLVTTLDEII
ncbi:MAG: hypothetical protein ACK5B9_02790 [Flavobacteriia bacterium]